MTHYQAFLGGEDSSNADVTVITSQDRVTRGEDASNADVIVITSQDRVTLEILSHW